MGVIVQKELPVKYRYFIKGDLKLLSPLSIGSGDGFYSDRDILLDADYKPFIPGTSIAGVIRNFMSEQSKDLTDTLFGNIDKASGKALKSQIYFYHAYLKNEAKVSIRDGVKINYKYGTAEEKSKYNYQIVETGAVFDFMMEVECREDSEIDSFIDEIISALSQSVLRFGYKKNRGFGKAVLENIKYVKFDMSKKGDVLKWIEFNWENLASEYDKSRLNKNNENKGCCTVKFI